MRVHTKFVIDMSDSSIIEDEFYEYEGDVAEAKGGGGGGTQVVKNEIPAELKPLVGMLSSEGMNLYQNYNPSYYPGSTIAPMSDPTQQALGMTANRALQGSVLNPLNTMETARTLSGGYLGANPYLQGMYERQMGDSANDLAAQFSMGGRSLNSGSFANALADRQAGLLGDIYGRHYETERDRMQRASQMAPQIAMSDYADMAKLAQVGQAYDAYNQGLLGADIDRFNWQQNLPYMKMDKLASALHGANIGGGSQTTTGSQQGGSNAAANIGTGLMAASALPSMFGAGGIGSAALGMLGFL